MGDKDSPAPSIKKQIENQISENLEKMQKTKESFHDKIAFAMASRWVEGGKIASRSLSSNLVQALSRLERFRILSQSVWKVRLPVVTRGDWDLKSLKVFCEGILDRDCRFHDWRTSLLKSNHASLRVRVAVAASLFLFRKVIPQEMTKEERIKRLRAYVDKMCEPQPTISPSFSSFVQRKMSTTFKEGWDKNWSSQVDSFTLPTSACLENPRSKGGPRGLDRWSLRNDYRYFVAGGDVRLGRRTEPMIIWTGGKWRLVTKFSADRSFLTPLHHLIYNHLSKKNWLLRGEANRDEFEDFSKREGEVFVSGDYESATDNLNISLSHLMLDEMRRTSLYVPQSVWGEARAALVARFPDGRRQSRGQMMGSLLSFPLLCLANYLTFKWSVRRRVPLKINGDDIVFRCRPEEARRWFREVESSGLKVSTGKTLVSGNVFSLNSTFFLPTNQGSEVCPIVRSTCLFGGVEDPNQIAGRLKGVYSGNGRARDQLHAAALKEMSRQIWSARRSVMRGLGCQTSWTALKWAGLKERECFYNGLGLPEPPLPVPKKRWSQNAIPDGYERVNERKPNDTDDPDFVPEMIECCWTRAPRINEEKSQDEYWKEVRNDTFSFVPLPDDKFARMAGMTSDEIARMHDRRISVKRENKKKIWVKVPERGDDSRRGVGY